MKKLSLMVMMLFAFLSISASAAQNDFTLISQKDIQSVPAKIKLILDVRTPEEYKEGHVPGAVNIPFDEVPNRLDDILKITVDKNAPIAVYCRSGRRAHKALTSLKKSGFHQLFHLEGDMNGWYQAGLKVEK